MTEDKKKKFISPEEDENQKAIEFSRKIIAELEKMEKGDRGDFGLIKAMHTYWRNNMICFELVNPNETDRREFSGKRYHIARQDRELMRVMLGYGESWEDIAEEIYLTFQILSALFAENKRASELPDPDLALPKQFFEARLNFYLDKEEKRKNEERKKSEFRKDKRNSPSYWQYSWQRRR